LRAVELTVEGGENEVEEPMKRLVGMIATRKQRSFYVPFGYHLEEDDDLWESGSGRCCWPSTRVSQIAFRRRSKDKANLAAALSDCLVEASIHCALDRAILSDNRLIVDKVYADVPVNARERRIEKQVRSFARSFRCWNRTAKTSCA
jgi:hypothetical protein